MYIHMQFENIARHDWSSEIFEPKLTIRFECNNTTKMNEFSVRWTRFDVTLTILTVRFYQMHTCRVYTFAPTVRPYLISDAVCQLNRFAKISIHVEVYREAVLYMKAFEADFVIKIISNEIYILFGCIPIVAGIWLLYYVFVYMLMIIRELQFLYISIICRQNESTHIECTCLYGNQSS